MEKRVGFVPRLEAAVIDAIFMAILGALFGGVLATALSLGTRPGAGMAATGLVGSAAARALGGLAVGLGLAGVLYSLIEGLTGASPGKMILKLKVGTDDGRVAPVPVYLTRWAVKNSNLLLSVLAAVSGVAVIGTLGTAAFLVVFVGCFLVLGESKQAIHDMVAKTAVYYTADLT